MISFPRQLKFSIRLFTLLILILLVSVGCGEFGLLEDINTDPAVRISLDNGGMSPGDDIDLWVEFEDNPPDRVSARLEQDGTPYLDLEILVPLDGWENQTGTTGKLYIPAEVPEGRYVLVTEAWFGDELLVEQSTDSYVILGDWKLEGLDSFPPQGVPGGIFFARAALDIPDESDPWIRWVWEDVTVAEGFYSAGWDEVVFETGEREGMGSLIVELHPDRPETGDSPIHSIQTELNTLPAPSRMADAARISESYSIFLQPDRILGTEPRPEIVGKPRPVVIGSNTGFSFSDGAGLSWEGLPSDILSLSLGLGEAEPFSLNVGFLPETGGSGNILSVDNDEGFSLVLSRNPIGNLSLLVNGDSRYSSTFVLPETYQSPMNLTLSFLPADSGPGLTLVWKVDGDTIQTDNWNSIPLINGESLNLSLGNEGGFGGVLTGFAIHVRDAEGNPAAESDRFAFYQDQEELMLIAEGFEDKDVVALIELDGDVSIDGGSLILPADSTVRFPAGGGGHLAIGNISGTDSATLLMRDAVSDEILVSFPDIDEFYNDSPYRISILLEKVKSMSDNETEAVYELTASSKNESDLRLEHILVARD